MIVAIGRKPYALARNLLASNLPSSGSVSFSRSEPCLGSVCGAGAVSSARADGTAEREKESACPFHAFSNTRRTRAGTLPIGVGSRVVKLEAERDRTHCRRSEALSKGRRSDPRLPGARNAGMLNRVFDHQAGLAGLWLSTKTARDRIEERADQLHVRVNGM
jgi:hypothetical protein